MLCAVSLIVVVACSGTFIGKDGSRTTLDCPNLPTAVPTAVTSGTCTWTASPAPTTTPPLAVFPTPATTGAPATTVFSEHGGDTVITTAYASINRWHVAGDLLIKAPGVTITNSVVDGYLDNEYTAAGSTRMTVTDTTIGAAAGCDDSPGLGEHDYNALRVLIRNHGDGFRVSGNNVSIKDSFVQTCDSVQNHDDGVQIFCPTPDLPWPCDNIVVDHNTLSVAHVRNYTSAFFGGDRDANGRIAHVTLTNNLLDGGTYTINTRWTSGPNFVITGNRLVDKSWDYDSSSLAGTCAHVTWADNRAVAIGANWRLSADRGSLACQD